MKNIKMFYMNGCPYCRYAFKAIDELKKETKYRDITMTQINENEEVALADSYDYYYVPTFYIDEVKVYECSPSHDYATVKAHVKDVFDKAL